MRLRVCLGEKSRRCASDRSAWTSLANERPARARSARCSSVVTCAVRCRSNLWLATNCASNAASSCRFLASKRCSFHTPLQSRKARRQRSSRKQSSRLTTIKMDSVSVTQPPQKKKSLWSWPERMATYSGSYCSVSPCLHQCWGSASILSSGKTFWAAATKMVSSLSVSSSIIQAWDSLVLENLD